MSANKKKISIPDSYEYKFIDTRIEDMFDIIYCSEEKCSQNLQYNNSHISIITPSEYAKYAHIRNYKIIPNICISLEPEFTDAIIILAAVDKNSGRIAYRPGNIYGRFITDIIYKENYETENKFQDEAGQISEILKNYHSIIITGEECQKVNKEHESKLYLAEEWNILTDTPFVAGIWVTIEDMLDVEEYNFLLKINNEFIQTQNEFLDINHDDPVNSKLPVGLNFFLGEDEMNSLKSQFEYCFFYGISEEIPDIKFYNA